MKVVSQTRTFIAEQMARLDIHWVAPVLIFMAVAGAVVLVQVPKGASVQKPKGTEGVSAEAVARQKHLNTQVDTEAGAPRDGRDPANQPQGSLAAAAASATGSGSQYTDTPAAGVSGDHAHDHTHGDVYDDPRESGIGSNGCYIDYGIPGEQCVPAHAATNGTLTCAGVRKYFPNGVKVSGTDRFHLDHNGDKLACGAGE